MRGKMTAAKVFRKGDPIQSQHKSASKSNKDKIVGSKKIKKEDLSIEEKHQKRIKNNKCCDKCKTFDEEDS